MGLGASPHIPTLPLRWGASLSSDFFLILHTCHLCPEFGVLARSEALRQQIRDLVVCRYISQFNGFFFDFVSEPVVLDVEVLRHGLNPPLWADKKSPPPVKGLYKAYA